MLYGRHDYPKAIHLLRVQGRPGDAIFFPANILREHPDDSREHAPALRFWESLIARACDRYAAKVHGYIWLPNDAILLLQRFAVPLRIILPSLLGSYSRYLHKAGRVPPGESPYCCRCKSLEVAPELLPYALRNVYARAVNAGLCTSSLNYTFCSRSLHFAESVPPWFEGREFIVRVRARGHTGRASVERFLDKPESPRHAELFGRLSSRTAQIAGEPADIEDSMWLSKYSPRPPSVAQVAEAVGTLLRSESGSLDGVLAAALTAWYATRVGAATLNQMGHWFDRWPTTLRADIESHRKTSPELFELSVEEFLALTRADAVAKAASNVASVPELDGMSDPTSSSSKAPRRASGPSGAIQHWGGHSHRRDFAGALACMILKEDGGCPGAHAESESPICGRSQRHLRKRS